MDDRLTWDPYDYGYLQDMLLPASKMWKPELLLNNK